MSRYRKTMRQAMEEGLSNMQLAILKKEYEPFRGKTISAARAKQLMNILDKFKDQDLQKLAKANIPFVSSGSDTKLRVRKMGFKVTTFNPMGSFKEEVTAVYTDKKTRQVKSKKFKDINTAKDHFRKTGEAAGQITYKEETELEEAFTRKDFAKLESDNEHTEAAEKLINMFGTKEEKSAMAAIKMRHNRTGYISGPDYSQRQMMVNKYYSRLR